MELFGLLDRNVVADRENSVGDCSNADEQDISAVDMTAQ
jgi:hypothetical protein